ncbi:MAG: glucose/arabinose dehydrogenase [Verrucomicrobiales bacterium]|jgi:glucose/arabinose dehydrogenase
MHLQISRRVPIVAAFAALSCLFTPSSVEAEAVKLQPKRVFEPLGKIALPAAVVVAPDGSGRQFVVQQGGKILILPADQSATEAKTFLDISDRKLIDNKFEEGLLGLAFHPGFKDNGKFYIYHTQQNPKRTRVVEMKVKAGDRDAADSGSERLLLEIPQPFWNHNSGNLLFGPDGFLYISVGDGGKGGDPLLFGQNPFVLNGTILRIDVDKKDGDLEYGIPGDNPFAGKPGYRGEVFAYGMRNPWGLSFDKEGRLWCADVGQSKWEEVNLIEKGGNYGWSVREGKEDFAESLGKKVEGVKLTDPIHQYGRTDGISITGGFVYQGEKIPALKGAYVFGDWGTGNVWAIRYDAEKGEVTETIELFKRGQSQTPFQPAVITAAPDGEIQVTSWTGQIYILEEAK